MDGWQRKLLGTAIVTCLHNVKSVNPNLTLSILTEGPMKITPFADREEGVDYLNWKCSQSNL